MKVDKEQIGPFIQTRVNDGWTDKEIALELHVAVSTAAHWRNKFNIRPANKFQRRFKAKHGADAIDTFVQLVLNKVSGQKIGARFGFSREYVRLVRIQLGLTLPKK